jgi:hypothetical protein
MGSANHPPARPCLRRSELSIGDPAAGGNDGHVKLLSHLSRSEILLWTIAPRPTPTQFGFAAKGTHARPSASAWRAQYAPSPTTSPPSRAAISYRRGPTPATPPSRQRRQLIRSSTAPSGIDDRRRATYRPGGRRRKYRRLLRSPPTRQRLGPQPPRERSHHHHSSVRDSPLVMELDPQTAQSDRLGIMHHEGDLLSAGPGCANQPLKACTGGHLLSPPDGTDLLTQWIQA